MILGKITLLRYRDVVPPVGVAFSCNQLSFLKIIMQENNNGDMSHCGSELECAIVIRLQLLFRRNQRNHADLKFIMISK